ncbi:hypothetical protein ACLKA7_007838 [Drosophila subpalustris]
MENDDYQPLLRRRRNRYLKWTESKVVEFLELVLDLVKDVPESLEKPTALKFYAKVLMTVLREEKYARLGICLHSAVISIWKTMITSLS